MKLELFELAEKIANLSEQDRNELNDHIFNSDILLGYDSEDYKLFNGDFNYYTVKTALERIDELEELHEEFDELKKKHEEMKENIAERIESIDNINEDKEVQDNIDKIKVLLDI